MITTKILLSRSLPLSLPLESRQPREGIGIVLQLTNILVGHRHPNDHHSGMVWP